MELAANPNVRKIFDTTGSPAKARVTPGPERFLRGRLALGGRLRFCPRDGGRLELSGVLGGLPPESWASRSAIRAACVSNKRANSTIRSSFSSADRLLRRGGRPIQSLTHVPHPRRNPFPQRRHAPLAALP